MPNNKGNGILEYDKSENKVSVIIPIYNAEKYLSKCIESVLSQTYENIELILVDDGSKDTSLEIMKSYEKKDNRVKILTRENKGQLQTREDGLELSTGEYVTFIDADDWIDSTMIKTMIEIKENYNADIVRCSYIDEHVEENRHVANKPPFDKVQYIGRDNFKELLYPIFINTHQINSIWGQLIRKDLIEKFDLDKKIRIAEDLMFNLKLYQNINNIVFIPNNFYHYRANIESITNRKDVNSIKLKLQNVIKVYSEYYEYIKKWNIESEENKNNVTLRILKETERCINELYTFKTSHKEKIEVFNYAVELLAENKVQVTDNILKKLEYKLLMKQYYNLFIILKYLKFKIPYEIKNIIKKLLIMFNNKNFDDIKI